MLTVAQAAQVGHGLGLARGAVHVLQGGPARGVLAALTGVGLACDVTKMILEGATESAT